MRNLLLAVTFVLASSAEAGQECSELHRAIVNLEKEMAIKEACLTCAYTALDKAVLRSTLAQGRVLRATQHLDHASKQLLRAVIDVEKKVAAAVESIRGQTSVLVASNLGEGSLAAPIVPVHDSGFAAARATAYSVRLLVCSRRR